MPAAKRIYLNDIRPESAQRFAEELSKEYDLEMIVCESLQETIEQSDVISVAAAGPTPVKIEKEWLKEGCLFTATGHAEISDSCWLENTVVFDHWPMHKVWYEEGMLHPKGIESTRDWAPSYQMLKLLEAGRVQEDRLLSLTHVACGKTVVRKSDKDRILFISGGLPTEDVAWGHALYTEAVRQGLGQTLKLWDQAHWL